MDNNIFPTQSLYYRQFDTCIKFVNLPFNYVFNYPRMSPDGATIWRSVKTKQSETTYNLAVYTSNTDMVDQIKADEFFVDLFETILDEDEIVTQVSFPIIKNSCYMKFPNPASRYAMAGVFISKSDNEIRVAVTGAGENGVFRWKEMENALLSDINQRLAPKFREMICGEAK